MILVFILFPIYFGPVLVFLVSHKINVLIILRFLCFYTANFAMNIKTTQIS